MVWLFYLLSALLLLWALMAMALVLYSAWTTLRRSRRSALRARMRDRLTSIASEAGGLANVNIQDLAERLSLIAGKDRKCLRDTLVEYAQRLNAESLKPLPELYETLHFTDSDLKDLQQGNWYQKVNAARRLGIMRCSDAARSYNKDGAGTDSRLRPARLRAFKRAHRSRRNHTVPQ